MKFHSTNDKGHRVGLSEAIFRGLPPDNGLYLPERIEPLPPSFFRELPTLSFPELSFRVTRQLLGDSVPEEKVRTIVTEAVNFPAPLVRLDERTHVLELFHGPSLAFKDFGARFMARLMAHFNEQQERELIILVATSGDTGGAVAAGFYDTPGIQVVILYPSGKVSALQEKQLTTLGKNIHALEVAGSFDDCQAMVKKAFLDEELRESLRLSSANSINISRLIPQTFYYFEAYKQLSPGEDEKVVFSVPSGNFGNLTAGLIAQQLGLPVHKFIAATNANDVVPRYLRDGKYVPLASVPTLSNAMDVGAPSNFARMLELPLRRSTSKESTTDSTHGQLRQHIHGYAFDDVRTEMAMREIKRKFNYTMDPHGAVGYLALLDYRRDEGDTTGIILETAHPSKFKPDVERILETTVEVPERLAKLSGMDKHAENMEVDYGAFRAWLVTRFK